MTTAAPALLIPTGDPTPVEKAVADSIAGDFPPETFLWINFHRPDGGVRIWYAWTTGGQPLGDRIDQLAVGASLDATDWLHIGDRHNEVTIRGRVETQAYPLRPILADIQRGERGPEDRREALCRLLDQAAYMTGQTPRTRTPRWLGYGPTLITRKD